MIKSSLIDGKYLLNSKADLGKAGGEGGLQGGGRGCRSRFLFFAIAYFFAITLKNYKLCCLKLN